MSRPSPIIEYARKIGKNTAEFTVRDLQKFMQWYIKQPPRKDYMEATAAQRKMYEEDKKKVQEYHKEQNMANNKQYTNAMKSRLTSNQVEDMANVVMEEETPAEEIVCSMELTQIDVEALLWALHEIFENYDLTGSAHDLALSNLQKGLQGM